MRLDQPGPIAEVAQRLGRPPTYVDEDGFSREILDAAIHPETDQLAWVEESRKEAPGRVAVTIKIHVRDTDGAERACDIKSYNPFFGCHVGPLFWHGDAAYLIYREKHRTYACRLDASWPPKFHEVDDGWLEETDPVRILKLLSG